MTRWITIPVIALTQALTFHFLWNKVVVWISDHGSLPFATSFFLAAVVTALFVYDKSKEEAVKMMLRWVVTSVVAFIAFDMHDTYYRYCMENPHIENCVAGDWNQDALDADREEQFRDVE